MADHSGSSYGKKRKLFGKKNFFSKFLKKTNFFQNFDFLGFHSLASRHARNIMTVLKMFSWLWKIKKKQKQINLIMRTCQNFTVKMDENHKKLHFLAIFFSSQ